MTGARCSRLQTADDASAAQHGAQLRSLLTARLIRQGVGQSHMAGFLRELEKLVGELPDASLPAVNARLHYLGWGDVTMDYHSLQLALACLEGR